MTSEVFGDGKTVWVNGPNGECLARFSKFGIDIHRTLDEQVKGAKQCLHCTHSKPTPQDWQTFVRMMDEEYKVKIPDDLKPNFIAAV